MNRRNFINLITALTLMPMPRSAVRAHDRPVGLLLVRERGYNDKCLPCVEGRLYGVPLNIDLSSAEKVLPLLAFISDTVELSYEADSDRPSSIPEATYNAVVRTDGSKKWMWTGGEVGSGSILPDRAWRIELQNVPHRTAIQFHYGRDATWSRGCIIIGHRTAVCPVRGPCSFPDSPEPAVRALRGYVEANSRASNTPILVRLAAA
ncbi:DUF5675 family protein [Paraburkholderia caribensis]|uniref:DUF5675 family protein n=1 Tax=Paraburkholderia caribensis TaxID=75105 RepID=UPI00285A91DF|nr:DUF5675 family protein [Paraburkholderia caribensis]MDR6384006.1 hypothetical protein [Paraburkholderia caribensis]